jgi:hypothetical protein
MKSDKEAVCLYVFKDSTRVVAVEPKHLKRFIL